MRQEIYDKLVKRAEKKTKDGVYSYEGYPYAVIRGRLRFVGNFTKIIEVSHGFNVVIGHCEYHKTKAKIKELFNKYK